MLKNKKLVVDYNQKVEAVIEYFASSPPDNKSIPTFEELLSLNEQSCQEEKEAQIKQADGNERKKTCHIIWMKPLIKLHTVQCEL